jgi:2-polyprenyl-3-methyl-5-hydroxy-6-metoxy-1,4-benzoquinol methylase
MTVTHHLCHVCGAQAVRQFAGFERLARATSDCRPWPSGGTLGQCLQCGIVERLVDESWRAEAAAIYDQYVMYHQSAAGVEQSVFDAATGAPMLRSARILKHFLAVGGVGARGRMIDIGCGTGPMLRAFAELAPGWELNGSELNPNSRAIALKIPGVKAIYDTDFTAAPGSFDTITVIHTLEHITDPIAFLRAVRAKLTPRGRVLIQVPYFPANPFDLLVADHCTHFTARTMAMVLAAAGLDIVDLRTDVVAKEITAIAANGGPARQDPPAAAEIATIGAAAARVVAWIEDVQKAAESAAAAANFGLFGTSIAGNWLLGVLGARVKFFVDEDPARRNVVYDNRTILHPADVAPDATVFIALPGAIAAQIRQRLARGPGTYVSPPPGPPSFVEPASDVRRD